MMDKKRKLLIKNIDRNIDRCLIVDKIVILNRIAPYIRMKDIHEEGTGIRILFKKMDIHLLSEINDMIEEFKIKTEINLDSD